MRKNQQESVEAIPTIRILVLGDSDVGKTSLSKLVAVRGTISSAAWCSVQIRLHEYPVKSDKTTTPTPSSSSPSPSPSNSSSDEGNVVNKILYFVELYEMSSVTKSSYRHELYRDIDGIILVYNMLDLNSHDNLHDWLFEPLQAKGFRRREKRFIPIMVVGTHLDKCIKRSRLLSSIGSSNIALHCNAQHIQINCLDANCLKVNTSNGHKMRNFFNEVIDFKLSAIQDYEFE